MAIEVNHAGGGVAAYLLSLNTLLQLEKNGTLTHHELAEVVDRSLMQLETVNQEPSVQARQNGDLLAHSSSARASPSRSNGLATTANAHTRGKTTILPFKVMAEYA